jgi:Tfp pilus assembly protein PilF
MLKKSLAINPKGIDINYFYGEYFYDEREYKQAKQFLLAAQKVPAREG